MTELSPAARAVLDAMRAISPAPADELAGAAFRALANHQPQPRTQGGPLDWWDPDDRTRRELQNMAEELEAS